MNLRFHFMVNIVAGWVNRHQQDIIEYLVEEKQILIEQLGGRPKAFSNSQRIRLAQKAKMLGRRALFGIDPVLCPVRAPKCNAYAERFVRSIKYECLNRIIPLGEGHLKLAIHQYLKHYNAERNHQGIENQLIKPEILSREGDVKSKKDLAGC